MPQQVHAVQVQHNINVSQIKQQQQQQQIAQSAIKTWMQHQRPAPTPFTAVAAAVVASHSLKPVMQLL